MQFAELRHRHPRLRYHGYTSQVTATDLILTFTLHLDPDITFHPQLTFINLPAEILAQVREAIPADLDRLFFHLGLAELPSYYKAACPPVIEIVHQGQISATDVPFWQNLLIQGLGEFYYQNQIDFTPDDFLQINLRTDTTQTPPRPTQFTAPTHRSKLLLPIGGGKDSSTLLCMVEEKNLPYDILLLAPHSPAAKTIAAHFQDNGNCQRIIEVKRTIDPQLLALNQNGYLNGHTPFSAYLAFASSTAGYLFGHDHIWLGNERSSEEENLIYRGHKINHQYSKSQEFEHKFRDYAQHSLKLTSPVYRSALRAFSELEITAKLAHYVTQPKFTPLLTMMRSCNVGQKRNQWCHRCPKCAFVFTMLSAYLDPEVVQQQVFHENLFAVPELAQTFLDLAGFGDKKPFECVGTFSEVQSALLMAWQKDAAGTPFLRTLVQKIKAQALMQKLEQSSILILGLGREGLSTLQFLRQHFPTKQLAVADAHDQSTVPNIQTDSQLTRYFGDTYLQHLHEYDLIVKTAGIPISTPEIQAAIETGSSVTSNTQMFFDLCPAPIIGITGTKGKSTTSKLVYEIMQQHSSNTVLLGNIGEAPLNRIDQIKPDTIVVAELSCHQLAELDASPHISIVLDIKSEHLDYYKDFAAYFAAKSAIARYQKTNDYLIYNAELEGAAAMAKLSPANKLTHSLSNQSAHAFVKDEQIYVQMPEQTSPKPLLKVADIPLIGRHNLYNVLPTILVATLMQVADTKIVTTIKQFRALPHRLEIVAEHQQVKYINDSIAVNPHATIMAVRSFPSASVILLAGGYERNQDFSELVQVLVQQKVKHVIALPTTGERLHQQAKQAGLASTLVPDLATSVKLAPTL